MPHAIIEHSANIAHAVDDQHILHVVHTIMETCGLFNPNAVKTRRHICVDHCVGQHHDDDGFVHITVSMMAGRSSEQKAALSENLFQAVNSRLPHLSSLTVDIRDMDPTTYRKK